MRNVRASTGLEMTVSISGTTVPVACNVASTVPRSTRAICRFARRTEGRSQLTVAATQKMSAAAARTATTTRRAVRLVRTVCSISRSMPDRYLTNRDAMVALLKRKRLSRYRGSFSVRFQGEVFGTGQSKDLTRRAVNELEKLAHELRELVSELRKLVREV